MFKTMALKITETTYPVAIACLPPGFMFIQKNLVLGAYLVINDVVFDPDKRNWDSKEIELSNAWWPEKLFFENYEFIGAEPKRGQFGEIRHI